MKRKNLSLALVAMFIVAVFAGVFLYDPVWQSIARFRPWSLGLDLAGGSYLVYDIDTTKIESGDTQSVITGLRDVIERRVNLFGVSEPRVYTEDSSDAHRLIVELAGIKDVNQAIREIGETPFLDFREVMEESTSSIKFLPTELSGRYVEGAQMTFDQLGKPQISLEFNADGSILFEEITARNIGKPVAIFLDDELLEMPMVQEKISGGKAQITGKFTIEEARTMVERFNAGALPAPITLVNQQTISPDFGQDSMNRAIFAGLIGTLAVILFMLIFYRSFGIYSSIALVLYIVFSLAIFKILPVTMTLAGIAGFILTIGMAVDANILVFERTKEELAKGLSRTAAIEEGFRRAWTSIRDSNVSTMITSAVLYYFTSSFVRGFALTLFLGVVISMFSAITITRTLLRIFVKNTPSQTTQ